MQAQLDEAKADTVRIQAQLDASRIDSAALQVKLGKAEEAIAGLPKVRSQN